MVTTVEGLREKIDGAGYGISRNVAFSVSNRGIISNIPRHGFHHPTICFSDAQTDFVVLVI